ncbi:MAG: PKD domain-containing protein, partial [Chloroflexi bacterium]|nr:PKD domain-containing protein [Chloroflexota bacterium]
DLTLSSPAGQPGDIIDLTVQITNHSQATETPTISLQLPLGVRPAAMSFPAGLSLNLQAGTLDWLPVTLANGGTNQFNLPLRLETADISQPIQQITAVLHHNDNEQTATASLWLGIPPQVSNIVSPPQVAVGQPFQLRATVAGSGPFTQVWYLGDGRRVESNDPVTLFSAAGIYELLVEVSNPVGTVQQRQTISIVPHPAAQFSVSDATAGVGQAITFINQSGGAGPLTYLWDFGDGTTTVDATPSHQYTAPGSYLVHLTVQNSFGQSEAYWPVTVGLPPTADLFVPERIPAGQAFQVQGFGDASISRFEWSMGDGRSYEGALVEHSYSYVGDVYVTLVASNEFGSIQIGRWLTVDPGILHLYLPLITHSVGQEAAPATEELADVNLPEVGLDEPFLLRPMAVPPNSSHAEQLFLYINEARRQFDLPLLNLVPELSVAAAAHTTDMARFAYTAHTGADGSTSAERLIQFSYGGGYAGEATAWGFEYPHQAVQFWVNSPAHRRIILNATATDVGVGYSLDYDAPNVWYWTAEFGNQFAPPTASTLRLQEPAPNLEAMVTSLVTFSWNWPAALAADEQFVLYLQTNQGDFAVATVTQPTLGTRYAIQLAANDLSSGNARLHVNPGNYSWQLQLENGAGNVALQGESRPIIFTIDPDAPLPTPTPTATAPAALPTITATPTATPTAVPPQSTPQPTSPPPLITATPNG